LVLESITGSILKSAKGYTSYLDNWIEPRWGKDTLESIVPGEVEDWLRSLRKEPNRRKRNNPQPSVAENDKVSLAPATKEKIRDNGLPIGLQIAGKPWEEVAVIQLAHQYEKAASQNRTRHK
jgi:hypothetical protein